MTQLRSDILSSLLFISCNSVLVRQHYSLVLFLFPVQSGVLFCIIQESLIFFQIYFVSNNQLINQKLYLSIYVQRKRKQMTEKNPTQVLDKLTRNRIFNSRYWKQECFALNAQTIIDKAIKLKTIGGLYGGSKRPTKFLCLLMKMLQMNVPKEIALEYLKAREYKYLTALTLFYLRLTIKGAEVFELIEPFYNDNRKLVIKDTIGRHEIIHIDEFADKLLTQEVVMGLGLPFLQKRMIFQEQGLLEERVSMLEQEDFQNQPQENENVEQQKIEEEQEIQDEVQ